MTLQKIKSINGKDEYVLLPMPVYHALKKQIEYELAAYETGQDNDQKYVPFILEDYVDNPVARVSKRVLNRKCYTGSSLDIQHQNTAI